MPRKLNPPLVRRAQADLDVFDALDHYLAESVSAAEGFVAALERAYGKIIGPILEAPVIEKDAAQDRVAPLA